MHVRVRVFLSEVINTHNAPSIRLVLCKSVCEYLPFKKRIIGVKSTCTYKGVSRSSSRTKPLVVSKPSSNFWLSDSVLIL